jgi:hypothetical protein
VDIYGIPSIFLLSSSHHMLVDMLIASSMQSTKLVTAGVPYRQSKTSDLEIFYREISTALTALLQFLMLKEQTENKQIVYLTTVLTRLQSKEMIINI